MCLVEGGVLVCSVLAIGLGAAAGSAFQALVFRIEQLEAATLATAAAVLSLATGLAIFNPAPAAARTDPMRTIRLE